MHKEFKRNKYIFAEWPRLGRREITRSVESSTTFGRPQLGPLHDGAAPRNCNMNTLPLEVGFKAPSLLLVNGLKHFFSTRDAADSEAKDELVYDQAFTLVKVRLLKTL